MGSQRVEFSVSHVDVCVLISGKYLVKQLSRDSCPITE